jgi:DNA-binding NtrC family response regulator
VSGERILVVDDEMLIRWSLQQDLTKEGYEVLTAESGEDALGLVEGEALDLVLLDIHLPGMDGIAVLKRIRELDPGLPVIMITAYGMVETAVAAMKLGAQDFLAKPFTLDNVRLVIRKALETNRLRNEVLRLRREQHPGAGFDNVIGTSPEMRSVFELSYRVAQSNATTVLLQGESGTGKDLIAKAIHFSSARADKPFMAINCATLPEALLESELFGHEKGAFTDAKGMKKGLFELADGGTILLDEIAEMRTDLQAKLLRVIEEKVFRRVGGVKAIRMDVRIIAASNRDLDAERQRGRFRDDLFFRLKVVLITLPPLRERREDVIPLAAFYLEQFNREFGKEITGLTPEAATAFRTYGWPGNVRELKNVIERAVLLEPSGLVGIGSLPPEFRGAAPRGETAGSGQPAGVVPLEELEREMVQRSLREAGGNQSRAAALLGISRDAMRYKMKKFGLLGRADERGDE